MQKTKKQKQSEQGLLVITRPAPPVSKQRADTSGDRLDVGPVIKKTGKAALCYMQIDPDLLQAELSAFLEKMGTVIQKQPAALGQYNLDTITLSVEITAKGKVGLLGSGGEIGGKGGLTFTFKRKSSA
ncbi:MAG: hypothetical protein AAB676_18395 [Verrucomicrobiota bacterium]